MLKRKVIALCEVSLRMLLLSFDGSEVLGAGFSSIAEVPGAGFGSITVAYSSKLLSVLVRASSVIEIF
jgi:hypothetical protein